MNDDPAFADMDRRIAGLEDASGIAQTILDAQEHARAEAARAGHGLQEFKRQVEQLVAERRMAGDQPRVNACHLGQHVDLSEDPSRPAGGGDPSGAVAELPDDAVEAAAKVEYEHRRDVEEVEWERGRWERLEPAHRERYLKSARRAVSAAYPIIAARVRAEAVADERRRIVEQIGDMCTYRDRLGTQLPDPHPADHLGPCPYGQVVQRILSAGSVPVATPEPMEETALLAKHVAYISRAVTASYPAGMDPELVMRRRVGKIFVESGELGDAIEGWTGENPRKGVYATREDVIKELIDCASASLCAIEYMTGDAGLSVGMVAKQVIGNAQRLSESIPDRCDPVAGPVATPTGPARCWCNGAPTVSHRRGTEGCRYAPGGNFAASPVPAEPARERLSGWFDVTEVPAEQPEER